VSKRAQAFIALATLCIVAAVTMGVLAATRTSSERADQRRAVAGARGAVLRTLGGTGAFAVFRDVDRTHAAGYGFIAVAPVIDGKVGTRKPAGQSCSRIAFAAGHGICLDVQGPAIDATLLDARLRVTHHLALAGIPSRARISPDGRWAGVTAFVVGHAYAAPGQFSTIATVIDTATGRPVGSLEKDFKVTIDGRAFTARDRNFWGLTFAADGDTFYATAAAGRRTWLVQGSISAKTAHDIHRNVECPSLSPDGTRIAYKKAISRDPTVWRFHVLDLDTGRETALAETRSIDDQLAWTDNSHVAYADGKRVTWVVAADGSGRPQVWMTNADSATVAAASGADTAHQ
jgi:hypothetical protein